MQRTDLMDTSDWAHREMLKLLRALTPEQRIAIVIRATDDGRAIHEAAMKRLRPDLSRNP